MWRREESGLNPQTISSSGHIFVSTVSVRMASEFIQAKFCNINTSADFTFMVIFSFLYIYKR